MLTPFPPRSAIRHSPKIRRSGTRKRVETGRRTWYTQRQSLPGDCRQPNGIGRGAWRSEGTRQPAAEAFTGRKYRHTPCVAPAGDSGRRAAATAICRETCLTSATRERLRQPLPPQASTDQTRIHGWQKEATHSDPPRVRASTQANRPSTALPSRVTPSERSICLFAVGSAGIAPLCHGLG